MHILYLTHDLSDPTTAKRLAMLQAGGAKVHVAGFARSAPPPTIAGCPATDFGRTYNGRFLQRILSVRRTLRRLRQHRTLFASADLILARNLEMLAIAERGWQHFAPKHARVVYEVLDIHRLLLREDIIGKRIRALEAKLVRSCVAAIVTSSPAFIREYFDKRTALQRPFILVENKVFHAQGLLTPKPAPRREGPPWRIGWFGAIRCQKSLDILCEVANANPGLLEVVIRGRIAHDQFRGFQAQVDATPWVSYLGPYRNPEQLEEIYHDVHFSWAIDMFEEGQNSTWLLPNRIYEGGLYGTVPITASGVETSALTATLGIGHTLAEPKAESLKQFLSALTPAAYQILANAVAAVPPATWQFSQADCAALVGQFAALSPPPPSLASIGPALVVIPCLNEAAHIATVLAQLVEESRNIPMRIVVADGGSTDGTVEIVQIWNKQYPQLITYLNNPKRLQSAAVNLAVETYGADADFLIRLDAHASYPPDFCQRILEDAIATNADSVTCSILTVGKGGFQDAVAAAQNSILGNGGSSHRAAMREGRWVDHAHHALMRIAAFRAVNGYDEAFTHNEDGELDARLGKAGYRIWLTAKTLHTYYPRATPSALFKQYRNYGKGRVRNLLKHRARPRLRQMVPVAVMPAILLLVFAPYTSLAAVPFLLWAGICLGYGLLLGWRERRVTIALSGVAAMLMHAAWSLGFWEGLFRYGRKRA